MKPSLHRLKKRWEFTRAATSGLKVVASSLVLEAYACAEPEKTDSIGTGFTATRRLGGAVQRNRVKRRLRAAAAEVLPQNGRAGYDYVLIGRHAACDCPYETLLKDLRYALRKIHAPAKTPK